MSKTVQIHFEVPLSEKKAVNKLARVKGISNSEFYRKSIVSQIKHEKFELANQDFNKKLDHDDSPVLTSKKELQAWLKK